MGFTVEIQLKKADMLNVSTKTHDVYEWNESCGEDVFSHTETFYTIHLGGIGFFVYGNRTRTHCSYGGDLFSEIVSAVEDRPIYIDGELWEGCKCPQK